MIRSIMWQYIEEEPTYLLNILNNPENKEVIQKVKDFDIIYICAHGSSYNAATSVAGFISDMAHVRVYVYTPSNFKHNAKSIHYENKDKTLVIGISETGTSRGVLEVLEQMKDKGFTLLTLTNVEDSPMDILGNHTLYYHCEKEDSNAKTKGYSCTLLLLMLIGIYSGYFKGFVSNEEVKKYFEELKNEIKNLESLMDSFVSWLKDASYGKDMKDIYVIGDGMQFGSCLEGQLKLMETMCMPTMFNDILEFSHGMHRSLNTSSHVLLLDDGTEKELMYKTYQYLKSKQIPVLLITNQSYAYDDYIYPVDLYHVDHSIFSIIYLIQIISVFVPELHGLDPNRDANNDYTDFVNTRV